MPGYEFPYYATKLTDVFLVIASDIVDTPLADRKLHWSTEYGDKIDPAAVVTTLDVQANQLQASVSNANTCVVYLITPLMSQSDDIRIWLVEVVWHFHGLPIQEDVVRPRLAKRAPVLERVANPLVMLKLDAASRKLLS